MQQYPQYPSVPQPPAPPRKRRKWPIIFGSLLLGVAMFAGCTAALAGSVGDSGTAISSPSPKAQATEPSDEPTTDEPTEPAATASPDGTFTGSCDYTLAPYQLIGDIDIENTGNVGIIIKVTITWPQLGYGPIKMHRQVKVGYGKTKTVRFHRPASMTEIDRLQSWQTNHGFADGCKYHGSMVDSFGAVHS